MNENDLEKIYERLIRLEQTVFGDKALKVAVKTEEDLEVKGPAGGIALLLQQGFFGSRRSLKEVRESLENNGYHYSRQAVHDALGRLSKTGGQLVALRDLKNITYAKRK